MDPSYVWGALSAPIRGEMLREMRGEITRGDLARQMEVSRDWIARREVGEVEITVRDLHLWLRAISVLRELSEVRHG